MNKIFFFFFLIPISSIRISGNAASTKNIHSSVSEQLKKNFAKSRWRVRLFKYLNSDLSFVELRRFFCHFYLNLNCLVHILPHLFFVI